MSPPRLVYRIMTPLEWTAAHEVGLVPRRDIDAEYFHLSPASEVIPTANIHFKAFDELIEIAFEEDALADHLKWELAPKRGLEFPHFYGDLTMADMVAARYLVRKDGSWYYDETRPLSW